MATEPPIHDAYEFARAALALIRAVRHDASEDDLLRQYLTLLEQRLPGVPWAVHVRDAARGEWRLAGQHALTDHDAGVLAACVAPPAPIGDAKSWSTWTAISLEQSPWPGLSPARNGQCVVMPSTYMDGEIAGSITAFTTATPALIAALDDAATFLWAVRTRGRQALLSRAHTAQYAALAEYSPDVIWRLDTRHRIIYVNRAFERGSSARSERIVGRHILDCVPVEVRDLFLSALRMINGPRGRAEFVYSVGDRRFAARLAPELDSHDRVAGVVVTIRDITEPFRLEQERQAAEIRCEVISDVARSVIYERRLSDEVSYVSPSIATVFGHSAEEASLGGLAWWLERVHPDDRTRCAKMFAEQDANEEKQWTLEFRLRRADGSWATVLDQGRLLPETDYAPARTVGAVTDITAVRALQTQLHHAHRMELIGRLAGGVAHDFNNVLAAIGGFTELLLLNTPPSDARNPDLREISALVQRATGLTQNLLGLSRRREHANPVVVDVAGALKRLAPTLRTLLGSGVQLAIKPIAPELAVHIDPGHLDQVVLNLAVNARDAMPDGGVVTITVALDESALCDDIPCVRIDVSDRGLGIAPEVLERVFQPYFTTKPEGHGTGLGLSVVHDIVVAAGGKISAESAPDVGTTFSVRLPLTASSGPRTVADPTPLSSAVITATVLLVDDEESVRRSTRRILELSGYCVLEARTGDAGLATLLAHRDVIDVIVTDLYMPGLSGPSLVERMLRDAPEIGCLVISGHAERFAKLTPEAGKLLVQTKPCRGSQLIAHVRELAAGTAARRSAARNQNK